MTLPHQNIPTPEAQFKRIHQIIQLLDQGNIQILRAMKQHGPRNLQLIARVIGMPYETLYSRIVRLEETKVLSVRGNPDYNKIGLSRCMVLVNPLPGKDLIVGEALMIPGFWLTHMRCMGYCNGYYSTHAVPASHTQDFEEYIEQFVTLGLASSSRVFWLGDQDTVVPNFDYYNTSTRRWRFDWTGWFTNMSTIRKDSKIERTVPYEESKPAMISFDERDVYIVKELMKDARVKIADFARAFGVTLPGAKYRFDNVIRKGLIREYVFDILPYAPEISELYEVRLDFRSEEPLESVHRTLLRIPFVIAVSQIKGTLSLTVRVFLPRGEMNNLLNLLTALTQNSVITSFSYIWLDSMTIQAQTFGFKKYSDENGWYYDNREYNAALQNILSAVGKSPRLPSFEPMSVITAG